MPVAPARQGPGGLRGACAISGSPWPWPVPSPSRAGAARFFPLRPDLPVAQFGNEMLLAHPFARVGIGQEISSRAHPAVSIQSDRFVRHFDPLHGPHRHANDLVVNHILLVTCRQREFNETRGVMNEVGTRRVRRGCRSSLFRSRSARPQPLSQTCPRWCNSGASETAPSELRRR